jgi:hypothetical protein
VEVGARDILGLEVDALAIDGTEFFSMAARISPKKRGIKRR